MKKTIITSCLALCIVMALRSQTNNDNIFFCGYGNSVLPEDICNYAAIRQFETNGEAEEAVNNILRKLGLPRNFSLMSCPHLNNAVAVTSGAGDRLIIYDNDFISRIGRNSSDWAALSILVHEIGHHLSGHTIKGASSMAESRDFELEADRFSGFWMYKLGATVSQAQQAVRQVSPDTDDRYRTHPRLSRRLEAIREGWEDACSQDSNCGNPPPPPKPSDLPGWVFIQGGTFTMGSDQGDSDEKPLHQVTLSDYYLAIHELTVEEFSLFAAATGYKTDAEKGGGSYFWTGTSWELKSGINWRHDAAGRNRSASEYNHPVIHVSWNDAVAYCNWRSEKDGLQKVYTISGSTVTANREANGYRLPTEAEWEFAARSRGKNEKWAGTSDANRLSEFANGSGSSDGYNYTAPVGSFDKNDLGLFDMSGNVWEWCWDWYGTYSSGSETNPVGPGSGSYRVLRGGSWSSGPSGLRCARRRGRNPDYRNDRGGFRLARAAR